MRDDNQLKQYVYVHNKLLNLNGKIIQQKYSIIVYKLNVKEQDPVL